MNKKWLERNIQGSLYVRGLKTFFRFIDLQNSENVACSWLRFTTVRKQHREKAYGMRARGN